jgi:hypothetical protein
MRDVFREGVGTKPPCPVHEEKFAKFLPMLIPRR